EHGCAASFGFGNDVQEPVHAVVEVDVCAAWRSEQARAAAVGAKPARLRINHVPCLTRRFILGVCLRFHHATHEPHTRGMFVYEELADQIERDIWGWSIEERGRKHTHDYHGDVWCSAWSRTRQGTGCSRVRGAPRPWP